MLAVTSECCSEYVSRPVNMCVMLLWIGVLSQVPMWASILKQASHCSTNIINTEDEPDLHGEAALMEDVIDDESEAIERELGLG